VSVAVVTSTPGNLLRRHLVDTRLAGSVATTPGSTLGSCGKMIAGEDDYTFGLSDHRTATFLEAVEAVRELFGGDPGGADPDAPGWIDPDATVGGIMRHRRVLAAAADDRVRVLLATGHPTGLLTHYGALARALQGAGCRLLAPLDDRFLFRSDKTGAPRGVRFLDGVATAYDGGRLLHTHRSRYMEAMLDDLGGGPGAVDLVVADHGMAGAAIERGIPTLSIADVNDPALPLAQARGRTDAVLPIDDNLAPRLFLPVTAAMLDWRHADDGAAQAAWG
jgi:hypothetical protein